MIEVTEVTPTGCKGKYASGHNPRIWVVVTGDEGGFDVEARRHGGRFDAEWPAELAKGNYSVQAQLWHRVAHADRSLKVE